MILLLCPRADDPALMAFASYLEANAVPYEYCVDLTALRFGVALGPGGATRIRLRLPRAGEVAGEDVGVWVRSPWAWRAAGDDPADRFVATEYHAALWTVCALLPRVLNRPGQQAWLHERELPYALPGSLFLPEYWTTDAPDLGAAWARTGFAQAHVEDLLSRERGVFTTAGQLAAWRPGPAQLRALFAPSSRYLLQVCVGARATTVLNEPGHPVDGPAHRTLLAAVGERLAARGISFFALALVVDDEGQPRVARIITEPPWSWYSGHAEEIHGELRALLAAPR